MGLSEDAVAYVKSHRRELIQKFASLELYPATPHPETMFMAGSPGAGKTEWSRNFLLSYIANTPILRIDPDEIRSSIPGYNGSNSDEVQGAASLAVQKIFDCALRKSQSFLFDGTFANFELAHKNIERSIRHGRKPVVVFYLHQDPLEAWDVTKARQLKEGRKVPKETFINAYFASRDNVNRCKAEFGEQFRLYLINRDADTLQYEYKMNINNVDHYLKVPYTRNLLEEKLT